MLRTLKELLDNALSPQVAPTAEEQARALHLATAVLLVEVMRADHDIGREEKQAVLGALRSRFDLPAQALEELMAHAQETARTANDFHAFTSQINERFTHPKKVELVESLWHVAYADAHLDAHENHVISKVAGLLHVTHGEYIAAKMRAKTAADSGTGRQQ
ncbi:TerB family tellurite resistance protein [Hydrogenophaga sp. 5NK40-0174]|uniref:tellurite resistance TerB family protein n=1 Tax=Hydrogenophaga sp. 5NK40-0174 TaxID=3127649 RepID=UPI00310752A1